MLALIKMHNVLIIKHHYLTLVFVLVCFWLQLDHYPPVSYTLPDASDTQFNLIKTLFLGKVYGKSLIF